MELLQKDEQGNVISIRVEMQGQGVVVNPGDPGWIDHSNDSPKEEG